MKLEVFQWPCGVVSINRVPRGERPQRRIMFVLVAVSSMKTSLSGFNDPRSAHHVARASATSGRFCSAACTVFFCPPIPMPSALSAGRAHVLIGDRIAERLVATFAVAADTVTTARAFGYAPTGRTPRTSVRRHAEGRRLCATLPRMRWRGGRKPDDPGSGRGRRAGPEDALRTMTQPRRTATKLQHATPRQTSRLPCKAACRS